MEYSYLKQTIIKHLPHLQKEKLQFQRLSGLTNITYAVKVNNQLTYVFKKYAEGFDRQRQNKLAKVISQKGIGPRILHADNNCLIEVFVKGSYHPEITDIMHNDQILNRILSLMSKYHRQLDIQEQRQTISDFVFGDQQAQRVVLWQDKKNIVEKKQQYIELWSKVKKVCDQRRQWKTKLLPATKKSVKMCHNDLNNLNILVTSQEIYFVDLDYIAPNYIAYDIADLLNESSIQYRVDKYPLFKFTQPFTFQRIKQITKLYPQYYPGLQIQVLNFMCVVNFYWAIWSIQRLQLNPNPMFGIIEHGLLRMNLFEQYWKIREQLS